MESRVLGLVDDTDEIRAVRELGHATWFLNPVELEDAPIFVAQQEGVAAAGVRYSVIARGADATTGHARRRQSSARVVGGVAAGDEC